MTFFLPALPDGLPRRGFDFYSWFAAMQTGEIVPSRGRRLEKRLDVEDRDVRDRLKELRVKFIE
jgi:hypothetical protein